MTSNYLAIGVSERWTLSRVQGVQRLYAITLPKSKRHAQHKPARMLCDDGAAGVFIFQNSSQP